MVEKLSLSALILLIRAALVDSSLSMCLMANSSSAVRIWMRSSAVPTRANVSHHVLGESTCPCHACLEFFCFEIGSRIARVCRALLSL